MTEQERRIKRSNIKLVIIKALENIDNLYHQDLVVVYNELQRDSLHEIDKHKIK